MLHSPVNFIFVPALSYFSKNMLWGKKKSKYVSIAKYVHALFSKCMHNLSISRIRKRNFISTFRLISEQN